MIIITGQRCVGKCDEVPGLFYVQTRFFHVYYIPLIPLQSFLVFSGSESGGKFRGVHIPMSGKSVLLAWLRGGLVVAAIAGVVFSLMGFIDYGNHQESEALLTALFFAAVAVGSIFFFWVSTRLARAGYQRAVQLAEHIGLSEEDVAKLYYGTPAESSAQPADDDYDSRRGSSPE